MKYTVFLILTLMVAGCGSRSTLGHKRRDAAVSKPDLPQPIRDYAQYKDNPTVKDGPWVPDGRWNPDGRWWGDATYPMDAWYPSDAWTTPDWWTPRDTWYPMDGGPFYPDFGVCPTQLGARCDGTSGCCNGRVCTALPSGISICSIPCTPDNPDTPLVNEDSCPMQGLSSCANLQPYGSDYHCLPRCTPTQGFNTCSAGVACDPQSTVYHWEGDRAFCAAPACTANKDCPVFINQACNPNSSGSQCAISAPGAFCAPDEPGSYSGHCALEGVCELSSGLCVPHSRGGPGQVGSTCEDDLDCAGNLRCEQESGGGNNKHARNGYCLIDGCAFASTLPSRACPAGSTCQRLFPGGRCFMTCDLESDTACRGHSGDQYGDYECYAWQNLGTTGGVPVADMPTCEPADSYSCEIFYPDLDCSYVGLYMDGNPTEMACRDRKTGALLPPGAPGGRCLDLTTSGP